MGKFQPGYSGFFSMSACQPGLWKKSSWNEGGDYMEKVSAGTKFQPWLEGWKTWCNRSQMLAWVETWVLAAAVMEYSMKQNDGKGRIVMTPGLKLAM